MNKVVFILILVVSMASCNPQKYCAKHCPTSHDATTVVRTVTKDSVVEKLVTVLVPLDSSAIKAKLAVDSAGNIYIVRIDSVDIGNHVAPPQLDIKDNYITAKCNVDSFAVYAAVKEKYHSSDTDSSSNSTVTVFVPHEVEVPVPYIPFIPKVFMYIGIGFVGVQILKKAYKSWKKRK
ncbi:hypothetical protein SDC9_46851 [bioreactor metagenome]|uniref:Uncharacterized protein n=1 Tax=bioreactor metagenome TaxID=1076179 RepID=A0A644WE74_9ZZZZ